jgi:hypothetical protein
VVSEGQNVFQHAIGFSPVKSNQMVFELDPAEIFAFTPTDLTVTARDEQNFFVKDVRVSVKKITPQQETIVAVGTTNANGEVTLGLPSSSPGSIFQIRVEKAGYQSAPMNVQVSPDIILFDPSSLEATVALVGKSVDIKSVRMTNLTQARLTIFETGITGYFKGLIETDTMEGFSDITIGSVLEPGQFINREILKAVLVSGLRAADIDPDSMDGKLIIYLKNTDTGKVYPQPLQFTINVGVGGELEATECIIIDTPDPFEEVSLGGLVESRRIGIFNRCYDADGDPIALKNLKAEVNWHGNQQGDVTLRVIELDTQTPAYQTMVEGRQVTLFPTMKHENDTYYEAIITLMPRADIESETANFTINFSAEIDTDQGLQPVTANNPVTANILLTNLLECVDFEPQADVYEPIIIARDNFTDGETFTVDTTDCGPIEIDFKFCEDDDCKGGTQEGGIKLSTWRKDDVEEELFEVHIDRKPVTQDIPGIYEIKVFTKIGTQQYYQQINSVFVIIEPLAGSNYKNWFTIDTDHYTIPLPLGEEYAITLYNGVVIESVAIDADYCCLEKIAPRVRQYSYVVFAAMCVTPATLVLGAIIAIFGDMSELLADLDEVYANLHLKDEECSKHDKWITLPDWVINLTTDARNVIVHDYAPQIGGRWDLDGPSNLLITGEHSELQDMGVVFENVSYDSNVPVYAVVEFTALERVHGDDTHEAPTLVCDGHGCDAEPFAINCGGTYVKTHSQKFHLRFNTQPEKQPLYTPDYDRFGCQAGPLRGLTTEEALPKVKFNWNWNDIGIDECDASNPDAVYCDATQFSIVLSKRMHALDEFLKLNDFMFTCPETGIQAAEANNNKTDSRFIPADKFGLTALETTFAAEPNNLQATATAENDSINDVQITVSIELKEVASDDVVDYCRFEDQDLDQGSSETFTCNFDYLEANEYYVKATASSDDAGFSDWDSSLIIMVITDPILTTEDCWLPRTTGTEGGLPNLVAFVREHGAVKWTDPAMHGEFAIENEEDLINLIRFRALLIKDAYSPDFKQDFVDYKTFADTPTWFFQGDRAFEKYFLDVNKLSFSGRHVDSYQLPVPGEYDVDIVASFDDDWDLFDSADQPEAEVEILFQHLKDPEPNSPFYSLPFNGLVGLDGSVLNRQGYGLMYINNDEVIGINEDVDAVQTLPDSGSNALFILETDVKDDLLHLNSLADTRGNLLSVTAGSENTRNLDFSPSLATPVIVRVSHGVDSEPFSAFYTLSQNYQPIGTGNVLTQWQGYGNCIDFTDQPMLEAFNYTWDRAATPDDGLPEWQSTYAVDWQQSVHDGKVYLRTVFYTPRDKVSDLTSLDRFKIKFLTPDTSFSESVPLTGISSMEHNRPGAGQLDMIDSVEDVFDLVKSEVLCVTDNGTEARFWWNPKTLYTAAGSESSIHSQLTTVERECIQPN